MQMLACRRWWMLAGFAAAAFLSVVLVSCTTLNGDAGGSVGFMTTVPADGSEVELMTKLQKDFLSLPRQVRRERFADADYRRVLAEGKWHQRPVQLSWTWNLPQDEGVPVFAVEVNRVKDGLPVALVSSSVTNVTIDNLEVATEYVWHVNPVLMGRKLNMVATGHFRTAGDVPRTIRIDGVANSRDLGGYVGLGGRRVRQGLAIRSAGFNANSEPVFFTEEELRAPGLDLSGKEREKRTDGKPPRIIKEWRRGKDYVTSAGRRYMLETLGVRTEIDLRSDGETAGLVESPLGKNCRWVHVPSWSYGNMVSEKGQELFANVFEKFLDKSNYPIVFHCISGQDRTGSVAFILNGLLGVSEEDLYRDWEATGFWNRNTTWFVHANLLDKLVKSLDSYEGDTINDRIYAYVKSSGFTDDDINRFRAIMLE